MKSRRTAFRLAAGSLILGAVMHVVTLWPRVHALGSALAAPRGFALLVAGWALSAVTALLACLLAALLLWKAVNRADARALILFLALLAVFWGSLFRFLTVNANAHSVNVSLSYGSGFVAQSASLAYLLAVAAFLRFSSLFPVPLASAMLPPVRHLRLLRRLRTALLQGPVVWGCAIVCALLVWFVPRAAGSLQGPGTASAQMPPALSSVILGIAALVYVGLPLATIVLGARNLRASYRVATPAQRHRVLWIVVGFTSAAWSLIASLGLLAVAGAFNLDQPWLDLLIPLGVVMAPLLVVTGTAIGILYGGAMDPALVVRSSAVYGALGALGVVVFAGIENLLSNLVEQRLGLPGFIGSMAAGALVTAALIPVRRPLHHAATRLIAALREGSGPSAEMAPGAAPSQLEQPVRSTPALTDPPLHADD